jgi:hypothetical protein
MTTATLAHPPGWRVMEDESVPLIDVRRACGLSHNTLDYAIRTGVLPIARQGGHGVKGNTRYVSLSDALLIAACASLAALAGVAVITILRAVRTSGGGIVDGSLVIPLGGLK